MTDSAPHTIRFEFPGALLEDGFWLYVWRVRTCDNREVLYVGRTGDSSLPNAASPFQRIGQHLGNVAASNVLRTHPGRRGIEPEECASFEFVVRGPLFPRQASLDAHKPFRDRMAALEKALAEALRDAGYDVLNTVRANVALWASVRSASAAHFPALRQSDG